MADVNPFRGWRYDLGQVGSLSDVTAPPYDVISPEQQRELYDLHPCNVIRLILNRDEPGDADPECVTAGRPRFCGTGSRSESSSANTKTLSTFTTRNSTGKAGTTSDKGSWPASVSKNSAKERSIRTSRRSPGRRRIVSPSPRRAK